MGPVERLTPAASNPVLRVEPRSRDRRRERPDERPGDEREDPARETHPDPVRESRPDGASPADWLDPDAPGRRIDIKA